MKCATCDAPAVGLRTVNREAALLHDLLHGGGIYIAPPDGYVLPACADHLPSTHPTEGPSHE